MIRDKTGRVMVPDVWTNENWREGLDNVHHFLRNMPEAQVPREAYGVQTTDPALAKLILGRTCGLYDAFQGYRWLYQRAKSKPEEIDFHDPEVSVFTLKQKLENFPGADQDGAIMLLQAGWGFRLFPNSQELTTMRFSETLTGIQLYEPPYPPFMTYLTAQGGKKLDELVRLNPTCPQVKELLKELEVEAQAAA